jgi:hypothetical protein
MGVDRKRNDENKNLGEITEWLKVTYCKFVGIVSFVGSNPALFKNYHAWVMKRPDLITKYNAVR